MRIIAVWKGFLSFGLVKINIELYSAIKPHSFGFKLLHAKCHLPITYERWCDHCKQEVDWKNIVKGYKLPDGSYYILTKENLEKLKPVRTDSISIVEFIDTRSLEPIYYDQHYYIAPANVADKAFFLFAKILEKLDKIAIGQFVLRDKEYVCAIQAFRNSLLLTTLNYEYEIKKVTKIEELAPLVTINAELKLAEQLVNKLSIKKFDMGRFKDKFTEELKLKIEKASKGMKIPVLKSEKTKETKNNNLLQTLQESLKTKKNNKSKNAKAKVPVKAKLLATKSKTKKVIKSAGPKKKKIKKN